MSELANLWNSTKEVFSGINLRDPSTWPGEPNLEPAASYDKTGFKIKDPSDDGFYWPQKVEPTKESYAQLADSYGAFLQKQSDQQFAAQKKDYQKAWSALATKFQDDRSVIMAEIMDKYNPGSYQSNLDMINSTGAIHAFKDRGSFRDWSKRTAKEAGHKYIPTISFIKNMIGEREFMNSWADPDNYSPEFKNMFSELLENWGPESGSMLPSVRATSLMASLRQYSGFHMRWGWDTDSSIFQQNFGRTAPSIKGNITDILGTKGWGYTTTTPRGAAGIQHLEDQKAQKND